MMQRVCKRKEEGGGGEGDKEQEVETAARTSGKRKMTATMMKGATRRKERSRTIKQEVEVARGLSNEKYDGLKRGMLDIYQTNKISANLEENDGPIRTFFPIKRSDELMKRLQAG